MIRRMIDCLLFDVSVENISAVTASRRTYLLSLVASIIAVSTVRPPHLVAFFVTLEVKGTYFNRTVPISGVLQLISGTRDLL